MLKILKFKSGLSANKRFLLQSAQKTSNSSSIYEKYLGKNSGVLLLIKNS